MTPHNIILAKDELEAAKFKLMKSWLKLCFKGKKRIKRADLEFGMAQFLDKFYDNVCSKILEEWERYNMVIKLDDREDDYFVLNPDIDDIRILTRIVRSPLITASKTNNAVTKQQNRPSTKTTEMAETLTDHWIKELESIPPTYIDLGKEDFEI